MLEICNTENICLPEPTGTKFSVASNISFDCNNVQPRYAFCFAVPSCPDSSSGTLHCLIDLRQPIPKCSLCRGHIVISWMFTGVLKQTLLAIRVTSTKLQHFFVHIIFLLQDTRAITWQDWFFDLGSGPHSPPTNNKNVQAMLENGLLFKWRNVKRQFS